MQKFDFLKDGLWLISAPHFGYDFSRKMFLVLYYITWPSFIVWLSLLLDILDNNNFVIICYPISIIWRRKFWTYPWVSNQANFQHYQKKYVYDCLRKMFLILFSINWPSFTVWIPLLLHIFDNVFSNYVSASQFILSHVLKLTLSFLSTSFSTWSKKSEQKFKYLENKKSILGEIKSISHHF